MVAEDDKHEGPGWSLGLKATPRKGRSKELKEERCSRAAKKVLFVVDNEAKNTPPFTDGVEKP